MLLQFRQLTRGWIAALILGVLIVAFALWGVNDVFNGIGSANAAKVGAYEITPQQLGRTLDQALRAQRERGQPVTRADAVAQGAHLQILDQLIGQRALWNFAKVHGVQASHVQVANVIRDIPALQDPISGTFSEDGYGTFLAQINYTRSEFETEVRSDLSASMLMQALTAGLRAPASYGALALAFESERRTITVAEAPISLVGAIPAPTDEQIQAFYEENQERLRIPEYRGVTLVFASADDFTASVNVPEEQIREEFEARRASLTQPERRSLVQIAASDEASARAAAQQLTAGEDPQAVAAALGLQVVRYDDAVREDVIDGAVAAAGFTMAAGEPARAVRARLTPWAAVALVNITPGAAPDLEAARAQIRGELAQTEASERLNNAVTAFEDARSSGQSVVEAARASGLRIVQAEAVDARGFNRQFQPDPAIAGHEDLLEMAFETPEGEASDFVPAGDAGDVVIAVDRIIPASVRPLEEVRGELAEGWTARERMRRLNDIGVDLTEAVQGGQSFAAAARQRGLRMVAASQPITRQEAAQLPARRLASLIYGARVGEVVTDIRADGQALIAAVVEEVARETPEAAPERAEVARQQMQQSLAESLAEAMQNAARDRARPRRNDRLIERVFGGAEGADEQGS